MNTSQLKLPIQDLSRVIVWVSAGAASAVAWKLAFTKYGNRCMGIYCDTLVNEHPDNARFLSEVSKWVGQPLTVIRSEKYTTIDEVFEKTRYMAGQNGARCTTELKKIPRLKMQQADDIHVWGFTSEEADRIHDFKMRNPDMICEFILAPEGFTKDNCFAILKFAKIALPQRYLEGFLNNNCLCCVKASSVAYWIRERRINPEVFARRARQSREIGARLVRWKGKRIFLDQIPPDEQIPKRFFKKSAQENVSCGPECGISK